MNKNLMLVVLESLAFFELAGEELVDPEAAHEQLDGAGRTLADLSADEKKQLADFARQYADEEAAAKGDPERIEFFRAVPKYFGLEA